MDLLEGMSRLLESRRQDRMKEINMKVSSPEKKEKKRKKRTLGASTHTSLIDQDSY